jgi:hypothetical protein
MYLVPLANKGDVTAGEKQFLVLVLVLVYVKCLPPVLAVPLLIMAAELFDVHTVGERLAAPVGVAVDTVPAG